MNCNMFCLKSPFIPRSKQSIGYESQSIYSLYVKGRCYFWDTYETQKHSVDTVVLFSITPDGTRSSH
jgi:hypothetical protein